MGIGVAVAVAGTAWGASIWARSVERPSRDAIGAYVDGLIALNRADYSEVMNESEKRRTLTYAVTRFSDAVELRPSYGDAFMGRGDAHFEIFLLDPEGRDGASALADYEQVIALGTDDQYSRGSLAALQWWQGDYEAAAANTKAALQLRSERPDPEPQLRGDSQPLRGPDERTRRSSRRFATSSAGPRAGCATRR